MKTKIVKLADIRISRRMKRSMPRAEKIEEKYSFYRRTGRFQVPIVCNKYLFLKDGYITYLLAKMFEFEDVVVILE